MSNTTHTTFHFAYAVIKYNFNESNDVVSLEFLKEKQNEQALVIDPNLNLRASREVDFFINTPIYFSPGGARTAAKAARNEGLGNFFVRKVYAPASKIKNLPQFLGGLKRRMYALLSENHAPESAFADRFFNCDQYAGDGVTHLYQASKFETLEDAQRVHERDPAARKFFPILIFLADDGKWYAGVNFIEHAPIKKPTTATATGIAHFNVRVRNQKVGRVCRGDAVGLAYNRFYFFKEPVAVGGIEPHPDDEKK